MTDQSEKIIELCIQEELEKKLFGSEIYEKSYKLPPIEINDQDPQNPNFREKFYIHLEMLRNVIELCGQEMSMIFGELCSIYKIDEKNETIKHKFIIDHNTLALGQISLALKQCTIILNDLENSPNSQIVGMQYCFIIIFLQNIFRYYTINFDYLRSVRYLSMQTMDTFNERLSFILSEEFDLFRRMFKSVESIQEIEKDNPTIYH